MEIEEIEVRLDALIESLAAQEHLRWAHWQRYLHGKAERRTDGALVLPAHLVELWEGQIERSYNELSETEKESDREQVRRYLPLIIAALTQR
ncbi:hypothetical protein [Caulobacter sp. DWR2-3-1b2]|uniref:hypothetical protein n=1 Tax=Caulobacter sp. DWR2-3-1b2 TaxID=2804642 RepID=UPI003CF7723D